MPTPVSSTRTKLQGRARSSSATRASAGAYAVLPEVVSAAGDAATGRYTDFDCADYESDEYQDLARRYLDSVLFLGMTACF